MHPGPPFRKGRGSLDWFLATSLLFLPSASAVTVFSRTGQFVIHCRHASASSLGLVGLEPRSGRVFLEPDALAVGCERVKKALLVELGLPDQWQGKIHVRLQTATSPDQLPVASATRHADGWSFGLVTPEELRPDELVRSLVRVLLLELADRSPGPYGAEIPHWLSEGLTAEVLGQVGPDLVPAPNLLLAKVGGQFGELSSSARERVFSENLDASRRRLREEGALTFEELSLPPPGSLQGETGRRYRDSARAFLAELRALPDGERLLRQLMASLTRCLNWQTAFLATYRAHFTTLLEVEKWWTLASTHFATAGIVEIWTAPQAADAMAGILTVTLATTNGPGAAPTREQLSLTGAMTRLGFGEFVRLVSLKQRQLAILLLHSPPDVAGLCREYSSLLGLYLELCGRQVQEDGGSVSLSRGQRRLLERLAYSLERLDGQRRQLEQRVREAGARESTRTSPAFTAP